MMLLRSARLYKSRCLSTLPSWATVDPYGMSGSNPGVGQNFLNGKWVDAASTRTIVDPMNGEEFLVVPDTSESEIAPFVDTMRSTPKSGLHNPLKNVHMYVEFGECNALMAQEMRKPEVADFFAKLIQRVAPKHDAQAMGEPIVVRKWLEGYSGDGVRRLADSFALPGDRDGQQTSGYRFPFGGTSVITPFNFPMEISVLQSLASVWMGNHCTVKVDEKVHIVFEQFLRMALHLGFPEHVINTLYCDGPTANKLVVDGKCRNCLFTGSQRIAEKLTKDLDGRVKLEDAGFDWKIFGPDVPARDDLFEFVVWQADQDAYGFSGQKCSAQSIAFVHENWAERGLIDAMAKQASLRSLNDLSCGPVLTWSNSMIQEHVDRVLAIPGAKLAFGGKPLEGHSIPEQYGAFEPTAVSVPLEEMLRSEENYRLVTTELFGPFQVIVRYGDDDLEDVLGACERMENHLTAAVVSNDQAFCNRVLGSTINGTTYSGYGARTTGAPQQHWFGPAGDPRAAGIHTPEAIRLVWSGHREIIEDTAPTGAEGTWTKPSPT